MTPLAAAAVIAAGTLVGMDLVSVPQVMISRPLIAAFLGGAIVGRPVAGLAVGVLLELFATEALAVGATRVPDWGPGSVAAGALVGSGTDATWAGRLGVVLTALVAAWLGGWAMHLVRRLNAASVTAGREELEAGDPRAVRRIQRTGLLRDAARGALLTALALAAGAAAARGLASGWRLTDLVPRVALAGATAGVGVWSGWRLFGHGDSARWLAAGIGAGTLVAVLVR